MKTSVTTELGKQYLQFSDRIHDKRFNSPHAQRRYVHRQNYDSFLKHIKPGTRVADIGAGEGTLSIMMAQKGATVVAVEISTTNIKAAQAYAREAGVADRITFIQGDAEYVPLASSAFDLVISCHVLEHLNDFIKGLKELRRITKQNIVFGVPTGPNWCAIPLVGGGNYWNLSYKTPWHLLKGISLFIVNLGGEGVDEGYAGTQMPHIWRYPWVVRRKIKQANLAFVDCEAPTLVPPYLLTYIPVLKPFYQLIDRLTTAPVFKYLGYGTTFRVKK